MTTLVLLLLLFSQTATHGQRHLPQTQVFRSPGLILLDTQTESPAVYDGSGPARVVQAGESFDIQVFAPRAARQRIYEYGFEVERPNGVAIPLSITSARDWHERELMSGAPNHTLIFSSTRFGIAPLPLTGHVMTLTLTATENLVNPPPLTVALYVTIVSDPPQRVNQMVARQRLSWG